MKETNVTIVSTNLNNRLLDYYKDYYVINDNFTYEDLLNKKRVIFFNILNNLKNDELDKLFNYLKKNNIIFINITNNIELCLYTDYLIIFNKKDIILEGNTMDVLKNEKLIKRVGLQLPFIIELSFLLKDYGLIKETYLNKESLMNALWN